MDWASNKLDINTRSVLSEWIFVCLSPIYVSHLPQMLNFVMMKLNNGRSSHALTSDAADTAK